MFSAFKKANGPLQFFLVLAPMILSSIAYAGNWIPYGPKTIGYAAITLFLSFFGANIGIWPAEKFSYRPKTTGQWIVVGICIVGAIIVAAVKHYNLTQ